MSLPLEEVQVLDFSRLLPGPWCTQFLSDLGANVRKVEKPGVGDGSRHQPPTVGDLSVYFANLNSGKKSLAIDLSKAEGRRLVRRLIDDSDVVIESFRPGVMKSLGIDYETVRSTNPDIIYCSISGFGQTGPLSSISGHDLAIQSMIGLLGIERGDGSGPRMPDFQAGDYAAAAVACIGILAALLRRSATGEGAFLDVAMFDSLFSMSNVAMFEALAERAKLPTRPRAEVWGGNPRYAIYATNDGKAVAVALLESRLWEAFCQVVGRPELINPLETAQDRLGHHGERGSLYRVALAEYCGTRTREEVLRELTAQGIPVEPVYSPSEAIASENVKARGLLHEDERGPPRLGPQFVNPLAGSGLVRPRRGPAPALGAHTLDALRSLGLSCEDINALLEAGVISR